MREILTDLNYQADILGSMVMTPDGIMVASALSEELQEDAIAAFVSSLLLSLRRSLSQVKAPGSLAFCILKATQGKMVFFDMENSFLVVVTEPNAEVTAKIDTIQTAIQKIRNRRVEQDGK